MRKTLFIVGLLFALFELAVAVENQEILPYGKRSLLSLNGVWLVHANENGLDCDYPPPEKGWVKTNIPELLNRDLTSRRIFPLRSLLNKDKSGFKKDKNLAAWYKKEFILPKDCLHGKIAHLRFGGVAYKSEYWLNGERIGQSLQPCIPFEFNVTKYLRAGENNTLVAAVTGVEGIYDLPEKSFITPCLGTYAGIRDDVEIIFTAKTYIDDVFIKTSVKRKLIESEIRLVNQNSQEETVEISALVTDADGKPRCQLGPKKVILGPKQTKVVKLSKEWLPTQLWSPKEPNLHDFSTRIHSKGELIDQTDERFGFREFEIRGTKFYLNGIPITLFRGGMLRPLGKKWASQVKIKKLMDEAKAKGSNCMRLHLGSCNRKAMELADEMGILIMPESAWNQRRLFPIAAKNLWMGNTLDYFKGWIEQFRNHPSVIIWDLCNETLWGEYKPGEMAMVDEILKVVRPLDPTRPQCGDAEVTWDKRLPIINIHYPESTAGALDRYPNAKMLLPNYLEWLKPKGETQAWRAKFCWDRPLIIGEYFWAAGPCLPRSGFMGESVFDWEKWTFQDFEGRYSQLPNLWIKALRMTTDFYRVKGVAGLNPWSGDGVNIVPQSSVSALDYHPNFFAGESTMKKFVVFRGRDQDFFKANLQCRLTINGKSVWKKVIDLKCPALGEHTIVDVPITCPKINKMEMAELTVRLRFWKAGGFHQLSRFKENIYILPKTDLSSVKADAIRLLDLNGETAAALKSLGLSLLPLKTLDTKTLSGAKLLIIGRDSSASTYDDLIVKFIAKGGRVIVLRQKDWRPFLAELPENDTKHAATQVWIRCYKHPVLQGLFEEQFSFWRPDNFVSEETFDKLGAGRHNFLLDCGGRFGLRWSPLVETFYKRGCVINSSLNLIDRVNEEPIAALLLDKLIKYALNVNLSAPKSLRLLCADNEDLVQTLESCGIVYQKGLLNGSGPILLDSSYVPSESELKKALDFVKSGGILWLHGFSPKNIDRVASLFPFPPKLIRHDQSILAAARRTNDPLMNNLSTFDFFWTSVSPGRRAGFFVTAKPTAKLGEHVFQLPSPESGEKMLEPAFWVKIPMGNGNIFCDTLAWEKAMKTETGKVSRIVSALIHNLGGDIQLKPEKAYDYFQIDLSNFANMGYWDKVADDGHGGWTDQGENDMRFFLVNHTGRKDGLDDGMEIEVAPFPEQVKFAKRPFRLLAPKKNHGKAVISLRGQEHGKKLISKVEKIPINRKADKLWFLHSAGWASSLTAHQALAEIIVHYQDKSQTKIPIRFKLELGDWWTPQPFANGEIAWTGHNLKHSPLGVWVSGWENPHPEKTIEKVDVLGSLSPAQYVLIGITAGVEKKKGGHTVSHWKLSEINKGIVPNLIYGAPNLQSGLKIPTQFKHEQFQGLLFEGGSELNACSDGLPGLNHAAPFSLKVILRPLDKPSGFYGGVFQCMTYGKTGFRLVLNKNLRPLVFLYSADGKTHTVKSNVDLRLKHVYELELKFDGKLALMFINGKIAACVPCPLPAPCQGEIRIGNTNGHKYWLNGAISEISICELPVDNSNLNTMNDKKLSK